MNIANNMRLFNYLWIVICDYVSTGTTLMMYAAKIKDVITTGQKGHCLLFVLCNWRGLIMFH